MDRDTVSSQYPGGEKYASNLKKKFTVNIDEDPEKIQKDLDTIHAIDQRMKKVGYQVNLNTKEYLAMKEALAKAKGANKDPDFTVKKGATMYRISTHSDDHKREYDNKRYMSLTEEDNRAWQKLLGRGYGRLGEAVYSTKYKSTKSLKIAGQDTITEVVAKKLASDKSFSRRLVKDSKRAIKEQGRQKARNLEDLWSVNIARQTKSGKVILDELRKLGYDGLVDFHGRDTAKNPIIVLDSIDKMTKIETTAELSYLLMRK